MKKSDVFCQSLDQPHKPCISSSISQSDFFLLGFHIVLDMGGQQAWIRVLGHRSWALGCMQAEPRLSMRLRTFFLSLFFF